MKEGKRKERERRREGERERKKERKRVTRRTSPLPEKRDAQSVPLQVIGFYTNNLPGERERERERDREREREEA